MAWTFISRVFLLCRFHFHPPNDRARVAALEGEVGRMQPNLRADKQYADVSRRLKEADARLRGARAGSGRAASAFARTKKRRYRKFMGMYAHVERRIDAVYKELTRSRTHVERYRRTLLNIWMSPLHVTHTAMAMGFLTVA